MSYEVIIDDDPGAWTRKNPMFESQHWERAKSQARKLYGVYVLFHDADAEPLGVENVIDFEDRANVFFMVDAAGNRWFIPLASVRWIEVTPREAR